MQMGWEKTLFLQTWHVLASHLGWINRAIKCPGIGMLGAALALDSSCGGRQRRCFYWAPRRHLPVRAAQPQQTHPDVWPGWERACLSRNGLIFRPSQSSPKQLIFPENLSYYSLTHMLSLGLLWRDKNRKPISWPKCCFLAGQLCIVLLHLSTDHRTVN